jgi:hypothetical protein
MRKSTRTAERQEVLLHAFSEAAVRGGTAWNALPIWIAFSAYFRHNVATARVVTNWMLEIKGLHSSGHICTWVDEHCFKKRPHAENNSAERPLLDAWCSLVTDGQCWKKQKAKKHSKKRTPIEWLLKSSAESAVDKNMDFVGNKDALSRKYFLSSVRPSTLLEKAEMDCRSASKGAAMMAFWEDGRASTVRLYLSCTQLYIYHVLLCENTGGVPGRPTAHR